MAGANFGGKLYGLADRDRASVGVVGVVADVCREASGCRCCHVDVAVIDGAGVFVPEHDAEVTIGLRPTKPLVQ